MALLDQLRDGSKKGGEALVQPPVYTHGLEQIYALETVDIRTVRPLSRPKPSEKKESRRQEKQAAPPQLEFDLGGLYRDWMPSLRLQEPVSVLKLTHVAATTLERHGLRTLGDLVTRKPEDLIYLKGLGQGHIDEIQKKLKEYLGEESLHYSHTVDLEGVVRCLLADCQPKEASITLAPYGLSHLYQLSVGEEAELRHLSKEQKEKIREEVQGTLTKKRSLLNEQLQSVFDTFLRPWMAKRLGLATKGELLERLERVAVGAETVEAILAFLSVGSNLFQELLFPISTDHYAVDCATRSQALHLEKVATSYFYRAGICYPLEELVQLVERECARDWEGFPSGFAAKAIRNSDKFLLYRPFRSSMELYVTGTTHVRHSVGPGL